MKVNLNNQEKIKIIIMDLIKPKSNSFTSDSMWVGRTLYLLETIYLLIEQLPESNKNIYLTKILEINTLITYHRTKCFKELSEYLCYLPCFEKEEMKQPDTVYENHGYLVMQISDSISNFDGYYINENLSIHHINNFGLHGVLKKYEKQLNYNNNRKKIFFNNGVLCFDYKSFSIIDEDLNICNHYLEEETNKVIIKKVDLKESLKKVKESAIEKNKEQITEERKDLIFKLIETLRFEQFKELASNNFDLLDHSDDIEYLKQLIELNYAY